MGLQLFTAVDTTAVNMISKYNNVYSAIKTYKAGIFLAFNYAMVASSLMTQNRRRELVRC